MVSKTPSPRTTPSDKDTEAGDSDKKPIDPTMFDGLMKMAETAGNQKKVDEPDLKYPLPEEGLFL